MTKIKNAFCSYNFVNFAHFRRFCHLQKGFTLIELLVAVAVFLVVSIGLIALVSNVFVSSSKQTNLLADSDQARKMAFNLMNELRNAQTSSTGAYPLEQALPQSLVFYSNIDGGSDIERIRYFVQSGKLYKGVIKPAGNPVSYNPAGEKITIAQNNLANDAGDLFYYYDGSYDGVNVAALSQPVSVTAVKFVKIDMKVYNKAGVENTNFYTITAAGSIRNLKENLADPGMPDYYYQLTTQASPPEGGTVAVSPPGPDYSEGSLVNLTAYANLGYGFSNWSGGVNSPGSASTTIVMNDSESVTANFSALAQSLTGSIDSKSGSQSSRRWTLRITNNNAYPVFNVYLYSFNLTHTAGTFCSPVVTSPASFPSLVGSLSPLGYRTIVVRINFSGCGASSRFTADFTFAGNNGANWGSASIPNQAY